MVGPSAARPALDGAGAVPPAGGSPQLFLMFQMVDNLLPIGGFSHSQGLESALQSGTVRKGDEAGLASFLKMLVQNVAYQSGPLVHGAAQALARPHRVSASGRGGGMQGRGAEEGGQARASVEGRTVGVARAVELDNVAHVLLAGVPTARNASLAMGRNLLRLARESFAGEGDFDADALKELSEASWSRTPALRGHFSVVFGAVCAAGGLGAHEALQMFLFSAARDALSAATRLNVVGPLAAQRVLRGLSADLEALSAEAAALPACAAGAASPLAGLLQASHPQLCSRLFQS